MQALYRLKAAGSADQVILNNFISFTTKITLEGFNYLSIVKSIIIDGIARVRGLRCKLPTYFSVLKYLN